MDTYTQGFDFIFKTIVIGDSGVGKTCLLERLVDDRFMEDFVSTIGVDFKLHVLQVDGKKVKLQIWDSAGQERFRGITRSFYRGANGVVICFDITRRESFDSLPSWIDEVTRLVTPGTPFVLVGCKGDMHPRGVTAEEAQAYAAKLQTVYVETSSKTRANVDQAFDFIVKRILQNAYQRAPPATNNGSVSLSGGGKVDQPKKNCCG